MSTLNGLTQEQLVAIKDDLATIQKMLTEQDFLVTEVATNYAEIIRNTASMLDLYKSQLSDWKDYRYSLMKSRKINTISLITTL